MTVRLSLFSLVAAAAAAASPLRYNRDIRPLLSDNCFHCHGPDSSHRKGGLRLDLRDEALKPAKSGRAAIVPGKPEESELTARLQHTDPEEIMPPPEAHKVLTAAQKETLRQWIAGGAPYEAHWAYTPVQRPPLPELHPPPASAVDTFIQAPLRQRNIAPSPEADRATLIRRLSLDLTGLPPSPGDVAAFAADPAPDAVERLTARLLASPHYGERMAQHWLDVVRYADTVGFHGDQNHNAWAYRDWVIAAFNGNMPFDVFTREQLAGDLLPNPDSSQLTATCFNRLTMMTREGGAQPKEYLAKYTADRVRTVAMAWLGATVGCAECHDHKFDPWTQKDFYSLGAFFADVKQWGVYNDYAYTPNPDLRGWSNDHPFPPEREVDSPALHRRIADLKARAAQLLETAGAALSAEEKQAFANWAEPAAAFLKAHPDGWETPVPSVKETDAAVTPDGVIRFAPGAARASEITIPATGALTAIRLELLPDAASHSISRAGVSVTLKPAFSIIRADGRTEPVAIRYAEAALKRLRYANGAEIPGITGGWTSRDGSAHVPHHGVWLPEKPWHLSSGDSLRVQLPGHTAALLRASLSPVITATLPEELRADVSRFLRCTPGHEVQKALQGIDQEILACRGGKTPVMITEKASQPLTIRVLARGNWQDESGAVCEPVTPGFLQSLPPDQARRDRLGLAAWLTWRGNPLTARVIMNRLWKQFFGTGLSAQVDDLGAQGEAPSHPELLDWLAAEFMESGWDFRHMAGLIVNSHTYRQSSLPRAETREADPQNRWLASQNARRLEAEAVRDNALTIAGLLSPEMGGPPVKPYQPAGYYSGLQFPDRNYNADTGSNQWRRGIYTHWQRTFLHPMLANFDAPSREDCVAVRTASNTPQQALTLLNDPSYVEAARVWAAGLLPLPGDDAARIQAAFLKALARPPSPAEREGLTVFLNKARSAYREQPGDAAKLLATGQAALPENADPVELAAWTSVCRVILNLHESITRY